MRARYFFILLIGFKEPKFLILPHDNLDQYPYFLLQAIIFFVLFFNDFLVYFRQLAIGFAVLQQISMGASAYNFSLFKYQNSIGLFNGA